MALKKNYSTNSEENKWIIKPSYFFLEQLDSISDKSAKIIDNKLKLAKINPYRNKRIQEGNLFLFRIRFEDNQKEKRVIYLIQKPFIKILCIIDRDKDYKDIKKYLKKVAGDIIENT